MELYFLLICLFMVAVSSAFLLTPNPLILTDEGFEGLLFFASGGEEKTEKASPKKLQDARKKGQVAKSPDVTNFIMIATSFTLMMVFGSLLIEDIKNLMMYFLLNSYEISLVNSKSIAPIILSFCGKLIIFMFVPMVLAAIVANIAQTGFLLTQEPLKPTFNKLNPINGFKDMFSRKRLLSSLKNIILLLIVSFMSYNFMIEQRYQLMALPYMLYQDSLATLGRIVSGLMIQILGLVAVVAAADYGIQRFEFMRSLKMTKQEIKEEYKQMEGDPFVKGKRRQKQREMAMNRMMAAVPEATVIVTNPTHFAVAIKYEHDVDLIPRVIAKGVDFKAQKIKELAREHEVPIIENKPLARTLYATVEIDHEIPFDLYKAVAEILAIVYRLEKKKTDYSK